jgi:manganese oxidase
VLGLNVLPRAGESSSKKPFKPQRKLELVVARSPEGGHTTQGYRLVGKGIPAAPATCPGPPLVLTQGEPVAIRVTNQLDEPTAVHWHGIELESFYDGVPGWSGNDAAAAPMIEPGQSFDVRMTPPRAGTFIYHTHMKDLAQLTSGLYGPLIVLPPSQKFDPATDKIFIFTRYGQRREGGMLINGASEPRPLQWRAGVSYRLRLIDIGANNNMKVTLSKNGAPVQWTPVAKDGADLPPAQMNALPASFIIAPGETYDFRFRPEEDGDFTLSAEIAVFEEKLTQDIHVKK